MHDGKNGCKPRTAILKELDDTLIIERREIAKNIGGIFKKILFKLGQEKSVDQHTMIVEQQINEQTTEETETAIEMLKYGKVHVE